jgi:YfiH family protein
MDQWIRGVLGSASPAGSSAKWIATGRLGGASKPPFDELNLARHVGDDPEVVLANRELVARELTGAVAPIAAMNASHGADVAAVSSGGEFDGVDGLVTNTPGLALLALAADCVTIALGDPRAGIVGVAHCGWHGVGAGIVNAVVDDMAALGAVKISAVLGPHVCGRCYPVSQERVEDLRARVPTEVAAAACIKAGDQWFIDVGAGVRAQLEARGVAVQQVGTCTVQTPTLFSYRRDHRTGRNGMMAALVEPAPAELPAT